MDVGDNERVNVDVSELDLVGVRWEKVIWVRYSFLTYFIVSCIQLTLV